MPLEEQRKFRSGLGIARDRIEKIIGQVSAATKEEIQRCFSTMDPTDLAHVYVSLRHFIENIEESMKTVADAFEELSSEQYPALLAATKTPNVTLYDEIEQSYRRIGKSSRTWSSIVKDKKQDAITYFRGDATAIYGLKTENIVLAAEGLKAGRREDMLERLNSNPTSETMKTLLGELVVETDHLEGLVIDFIHPQTLSSLASNLLKEKGRELPKDLVNSLPKTTTTWAKINAPK